jgi:steroid delta-isomerase-like uncharacterized protein
MHVGFKVENYELWKKGYDASRELREASGEISFQVFRSVDDPNTVTVLSVQESREGVQAFLDSPEIKARMKAAGIIQMGQMLYLEEIDSGTFKTTGLAAEFVTEGNKSLACRFTKEVWGGHNAGLLDELLTPDFVNHDPFPGTEGNREGEKQAIAVHRAAMAEPEATVDDQIAEGDKVATRWTFRATHKGEFLGAAPSGKRITITGINIHRIQNGKIAEMWREQDVVTLMRQLGAAPPLGKQK